VPDGQPVIIIIPFFRLTIAQCNSQYCCTELINSHLDLVNKDVYIGLAYNSLVVVNGL